MPCTFKYQYIYKKSKTRLYELTALEMWRKSCFFKGRSKRLRCRNCGRRLVGSANVHGHWLGSKVMRSHDELHTVALVATANVIRSADSVAGDRIGGAAASANVWLGFAGENSGSLTPCISTIQTFENIKSASFCENYADAIGRNTDELVRMMSPIRKAVLFIEGRARASSNGIHRSAVISSACATRGCDSARKETNNVVCG
jgi:hypothetical protein